MSDSSKLSATTRRVLRALSLFTGVQAVTIFVSVIRTKLVALWIGPAGVGLLSLYTWAIELVTKGTQFDIRQSSVPRLSRADDNAKARMAAIVRRLALILGAAGTVAVIVLSPLLSFTTFRTHSHITAFICLSPVLLLSSVAAAESGIMQAFGMLRNLAKSTIWSAVAATSAAIPLYYFFRMDAIVPVLVIFALLNCVFTLIYRARIPSCSVSLAETWREGRPMLSLGFFLSISSFMGIAGTYIFMTYLNGRYSEATVGIYQAGSTLINSYVGIIFTAITLEYYPRLSKVAASRWRASAVIAHESSLILVLLIPVMVVVICCGKLIVNILYSSEFIAVLPYITIGVAAMPLKALSWCMAYIMVARGDGRIYFVTETASTVIFLILGIVLFNHASFQGMGVAYVFWYALYMGIVAAVCRFRYNIRIAPRVYILLAVSLAAAAVTLVLNRLLGPVATGAITLLPCAAAIWHMRKKKLPAA